MYGNVAGGSVGGLILLSLILIAVWKIRVYQRKLRSLIKGHCREMELFFLTLVDKVTLVVVPRRLYFPALQ
jgi:hypothetical protein